MIRYSSNNKKIRNWNSKLLEYRLLLEGRKQEINSNRINNNNLISLLNKYNMNNRINHKNNSNRMIKNNKNWSNKQ
jgi:hypothetical protein